MLVKPARGSNRTEWVSSDSPGRIRAQGGESSPGARPGVAGGWARHPARSAGRPDGRGAFNGGARYRRYGSAVKRLEQLLALLDPGWLFIIAGLAMCAAAIIVPAQTDLGQLRQQLGELEEEEAMLAARLRAHAGFLDDLHRGDSALVKRLAAAQLNVVPEGERPVLLVRSASASVADWIEATVREQPLARPESSSSALGRLTEGPQRLWLLGGSVFSVFVGLLLSPSASRRRASQPSVREPAGSVQEAEEASPVVAGTSPERASSSPAGAGASEAADAEGEDTGCVTAAVSCGIEAGMGQLLVTSDIDDEGDVLDEDEVGRPDVANGALTAVDEPEQVVKEGEMAGEPAGNVDDEYEFQWDSAAEDDAEPSDADEGEEGDVDEHEDTDDAAGEVGDAAVVMDEEPDLALEEAECSEAGDDEGEYEYEYEYEYVYVDEPEDEGAEEDETDEEE